MARFREEYEKALDKQRAEKADTEAARVSQIQRQRQNLIDAEEWLKKSVIATLEEAKVELAPDFQITFRDNFAASDTRKREVVFTIRPSRPTPYGPWPHYVSVDSDRRLKCLVYAEESQEPPREKFSGTIDKATKEDIEKYVTSVVTWWIDK